MSDKTLVLHAHPLEESYSAGLRDVVCEELAKRGADFTLIKLAQGDDADLSDEPFGHLVAVYPTWWGGPPAVLLDWLQRMSKGSSPFATVDRITVVTTHGSSKLVNTLQGEPGKQTWSRAVLPMCRVDAEFSWLAFYKIDRTNEHERAAFIERVRHHFTNAPAPV